MSILTKEEIFSRIYLNNDPAEIQSELNNQTIKEVVCNKSIEIGGMAWCCRTCQLSDSSIICQECYNFSDHKGHNAYLKHGINGGKCDCGDFESWTREGSCSKHPGFIDESEISPINLPEKIRKSAIETLDYVIKLLNSNCIYIDSFNRINEDITKIKQVKEESANIIYALDHLAKDISPIFLYLIAQRFREYYFKEDVVHECFIRKFENKDEKERFEKYSKELNINIENNIKGKKHRCTCTMIENFMRAHGEFNENIREFINNTLLITLMGSKTLKYYMTLAYFSNYRSALIHDTNTTTDLSQIGRAHV